MRVIDVDQVQEEMAGDAMEVDTREQGDKVHEEVGKGRQAKGKGKGKAKVSSKDCLVSTHSN